MQSSLSRNLLARLAATALVTALSACASTDPTATHASLTSLPTVEASRWHFGNQHYRDTGSHAVRGSSGSATVDAEALFGADGTTLLTVTSSRSGAPGVAAGTIDKIVLKICDPSGRQVEVQTLKFGHGSAFTEHLRGLAPGFTFELQVQVSGLDHSRVDVVRVYSVPLVRRPDLAITGITLPSVIISGSPTLITGIVAELTGGHGATGDCLLFVDRVMVDRAAGIFVDAGDVVSCAFTYTFPTPGRHTAQVRLANITPSDANTADNQRDAVANVVAPSNLVTSPSVTYTGSLQSGTFTSIDSFSTLWTDPSNNGSLFLDAHDYESQTGTSQSAMLSGVISSALVFPLVSVELAQASGGVLLDQKAYGNLPPDNPGNADCIARGVGSGVEFYLCSDPSGFTTFTYLRATGTVTYASDQYQKLWNGSSYDITTYVANGTTTTGLFAHLGSDFTFDVRVTDAMGSYVVSAVMALAPLTSNTLTPSNCQAAPITIPPNTYNATTCVYSSFVFNGVTGSVSGTGATTSPGTTATP